MRILAVDVGTGTQDVFLYDSALALENGCKFVMPSPTMLVHQRLRLATQRQEAVLLTGYLMGGGPSHWAARDHVRAGGRLYATPEAARTFDDDLSVVEKEMGVHLVGDDEARSLNGSVVRLELKDFDLPLIARTFALYGVELDVDAVAVAVFDHGAAPPGYSDRQFRFDYLDSLCQSAPPDLPLLDRLSVFAHRAEDIPPSMTRLRAVAAAARAQGLAVPLLVMDTAPAAVLGAALDPHVAAALPAGALVANIGNFHCLVFRLGPAGIEGLFEHHTGEVTRDRLDTLIDALADSSLRHQDVFDDMGHGALVYQPLPMPRPRFLAVTGPRRALLAESVHAPYFAVPGGDMMLAGCFGLLRAVAGAYPNLAEPILGSLAGGAGRPGKLFGCEAVVEAGAIAMKKHTVLKLWMAALLFTSACGLVRRPAPTPVPVPTQPVAERQLEVFDAVIAAVRDQYVSADYGGVDWAGLGAQYRALVAAGQTDEVFAQTLRSLLEKLPPGTASYQTRAQRLEQETRDTVNYSGIGAFIAFRRTPQPHIVILSTIEGAPAERAGLLAHDSIYAIDGVALTLADEDTPTARIRGEAGTAVTITVSSPGEKPRPVVLEREQIQAVDALRGGNLTSLSVAYYRLPVAAGSELAPSIAGDLDAISETVSLKGIILDLRVSGSGSTWPLTDMLSLFGDGALGEFYTRDGATPVTVNGIDVGGSQTAPLILIVGADTSGTPEVFAAALQSTGRAVVIGQPTTGGVHGLDTIALPDGSRLFLATSSFRVPRGLDLARGGIKPNFRVDLDWDAYSLDSDPVLGQALSLIPER